MLLGISVGLRITLMQIRIRIPLYALMGIRIRSEFLLWCGSGYGSGSSSMWASTPSIAPFWATTAPQFKIILMSNRIPAFQFDTDPCGSGSATVLRTVSNNRAVVALITERVRVYICSEQDMQVRRPTWGNWEACAWGILCLLVHTSRDRVERKRFFRTLGKSVSNFSIRFREMRSFCSDLCSKRKFLLEKNLFHNFCWVSYSFIGNFFV